MARSLARPTPLILLLGCGLAALAVLNASLLSAAAGHGYQGFARLTTDDNQRLLALPLDVPAGSRVHVPIPRAFFDAGLDPWIDFLVVDAGMVSQLLETPMPMSAHIHWRAPLPHEPAIFTAPPSASQGLAAVWIVNMSLVPPTQQPLAESLFQDRTEPTRLFTDTGVTFTSTWFGPTDRVLRGLMAGLGVGILVLLPRLLRSPRQGIAAHPEDRLSALAGLAERATHYALQLRNLVIVCVVLVAAASVFGFIAFGYFLSEYGRWSVSSSWDDVLVLAILMSGLTILLVALQLLRVAQREVRRLATLAAPV